MDFTCQAMRRESGECRKEKTGRAMGKQKQTNKMSMKGRRRKGGRGEERERGEEGRKGEREEMPGRGLGCL